MSISRLSQGGDASEKRAWDLETIPDISGFACANDLLSKLPEEVREAMGDKFPKHIYHEIICIGALIAHYENDYWIVDALGAPAG